MKMMNDTVQTVESREDCILFNFVLWGIIGSISCLLGMVGNSLSFLIFQLDRRSSATMLLQSLACTDFILLLTVFISDCIPYTCDYTGKCRNIWHTWPYIRYIWTAAPISHMCSICFVVIIALNRYWAVCRPHSTSLVWSLRNTLIYVVSATIFVIAFNLPRYFEYHIVSGLDENGTTTYLVEEPTSLGLRYSYKVVYKALLVNIVLVLAPISALIMLTGRILQALHLRKNSRSGKSSSSRSSQEVTCVLVLVVVTFIIFQTPLCAFHFVRYTKRYYCGDFVFYLDNISKLMVNINSCINFVIYCLFGARFRKILWATLTCRPELLPLPESSSSVRRRSSLGSLVRRKSSLASLRKTSLKH